MLNQTFSLLSLKNYLDSSNSFYQNLLGYKPEQTSLKEIPEAQWDKFATEKGLNSNSSGIYLPRNQTAIIQGENPLSLFHEYFGHGLYCEQSLQGKKLVNLEQKLLKEEKQEFSKDKFTLDDLKEFRSRNETARELENFRQENLSQYELFAIWTEYLLSREFNIGELFEQKYNFLEREEKETVDSVINFSEQYGNLATMYAQGMARRTTPERVKRLLEEIFNEEKINNSKLILLTGSKKSFSDIDLFVSSNYLQSIKNNWLDLVVFDERDFEKRIRLFEVQVTYPIMSGEFIAGDENYLQKKRKQLQEQPITEKAIKYNFKKFEEQKIFASIQDITEKQKKVHISYSQTYLANALALKEGKRIFTKEKLHDFSHSEKFIELKGGIK